MQASFLSHSLTLWVCNFSTGKGTQCATLVQNFNFCHLSGWYPFFYYIVRNSTVYDTAGDLLRAEQHREGSQYGKLIQTCIREGTIVPMEVTIKLLENAMHAQLDKKIGSPGWAEGRGRFLIDGFPRKMDQALKFEEDVCSFLLSCAIDLSPAVRLQVCTSSLTLFFTTTEEVMLNRLLERGKTSGREDDNVESIKKRFRMYCLCFTMKILLSMFTGTYKDDTMPVIQYYTKLNKVTEVYNISSLSTIRLSIMFRLTALLPSMKFTRQHERLSATSWNPNRQALRINRITTVAICYLVAMQRAIY